MNNATRKKIVKLIYRIEKVKDELGDIQSEIQDISGDEQEKLDNMGNFEGTERYAAISGAVDALDEADDKFSDATDALDEIIESLEEACS